ncbi:MAG: hypothetical protein EPO35_00390 [Acidobacteria bacterium]|nr:MAG: hypothetical protein EPO35_00390 [Acidobacteriota bacterium]
MPQRLSASVSLCVLALSAACGGGGSAPTSPSTTTTTTTTTTTAVASSWTTEGVRITGANAGLSATDVFADSSTIRLNDGRWRMYIYAGTAYKSAISSDGLTFTMESGFRLPEGSGQSRAIRLDDGRIRIYFSASTGVNSAVSSDDGTTFTIESGTRISASGAGMSQLTGPGIIRLRDGRYRAYFSDLPIPGQGVLPHMVKSAISSDLVNWSVESGVRVGPGSTLSGSAEHPCAILNSDGSTTIFYFRNTDLILYSSTSADGLTFSAETSTGISQANDPDIVTLTDGTVRLYYNWINSAGGFVSSARRSTANAFLR